MLISDSQKIIFQRQIVSPVIVVTVASDLLPIVSDALHRSVSQKQISVVETEPVLHPM